MSEIARRMIEDALAANRLVEEQRSIQRIIDLQEEAARAVARHDSIARASTEQMAALVRDLERVRQMTTASNALGEAARQAVERTILAGTIAHAALRNAAWVDSILSVRNTSAGALAGIAAAVRDVHLADETALGRLARQMASMRSQEGELARLATQGLVDPLQAFGLGNASLLSMGLGHGWTSSSLAIGLAPARAVAVLATELEEDLGRQDPAALRTLELAAAVSEDATAGGQELAEVTDLGADDDAENRLAEVQVALPRAIEHPLVLFHAFGREIVALGAQADNAQIRAFRQSSMFGDVSRLISTCRRQSTARHGADIFGASPDAIDAQMLFMTACVVDQSTASNVLAALYVLLCESTDAAVLKAYREHASGQAGWVDVEEMTSILRNNIGTMHDRNEPQALCVWAGRSASSRGEWVPVTHR